MSLAVIAGLVGCVMIAGGYISYKFSGAKKEINRLLDKVNRLDAEKKRQAAEIKRKDAEVKNAKTQQKYTQDAARISSHAVDEQLHQHGWFRDADHHHGLHSVPPAVSKPSGYSGDQTSDTGSQSDL